ncbi:17553_t:CDS:2, partial [Gigaspora margarita]
SWMSTNTKTNINQHTKPLNSNMPDYKRGTLIESNSNEISFIERKDQSYILLDYYCVHEDC